MSDEFPIPFGRYQLVERLAVGGMAELFKARVVGAHGFQKPAVIKRILPHLAADPAFVAMFIDEAKITARLSHPKIAQVLELGKIEEQLYIAMEFVDGPDVLALLRACAQRKQVLPAQIAVHIAHEVLDALEYAHRAVDDDGGTLGIVHRDISPSNVLISRRGDVKLADFGIAHAVERQQKTQAGTLKGKYGYMSPEQVIGGELSPKSDLFSVGIVLAEMLMGRRLFTAPNDLDVLLMVRDVRLERLEKYGMHIEPKLREVLLKSLARDPKDRYATAGAFREALAEWLFDQRMRVGPRDLSTLVEMLDITAQKTPPPGPVPQAVPQSRGTIAGPETQARVAAAQQMAQLGLAEAAKLAEAAPAPAAPAPAPAAKPAAPSPAPAKSRPPTPAVPPTRRPAASPPGSAVPAPRAATTPATPQAVRLDLGETDPSQGGVIAVLADGTDSGPVVVVEHMGGDTPLPAAAAQPPRATPGEPKPAEGSGPLFPDLDFSDLNLDLELGGAPPPAPSKPAPEVIESVKRDPPPRPAPPKVGVIDAGADMEGELATTPPIKVLYKLAVEKATGLLVVEISAITKEIYLASGAPEFVSSNVARELLGEYLVNQKVISAGELSMALAMMPHFGGKLGDTLVGLGLMKPLDVFRHLTRQVRDKIVDVCTWHKGKYRWYRGRRNHRDAFPLGLDAFEVLGAGASALPAEQIDAWLAEHAGRRPAAVRSPRVVPEAFRLGTYPRDVYNRLDGRKSVQELAALHSDVEERRTFLRTLYLLVQTELATF